MVLKLLSTLDIMATSRISWCMHRRSTFDGSIYQIYDSLLTHAFLWRHNFRAIILAPSVVSAHIQLHTHYLWEIETKDGAKATLKPGPYLLKLNAMNSVLIN